MKRWLHLLAQPLNARMLALGFAAGLPLLLVVGTLSFRLREAGIDRGAISLLSWVGLAYGFKWVWAPLVDRLPLPWLTGRLGQRRGWLLLGQIGVMLGLTGMALVHPQHSLGALVACALLAAFASATQDIALDAWRIESAPPEQQGVLAACYQTGYRLAMIWAGAGALWLASLMGGGHGAAHVTADGATAGGACAAAVSAPAATSATTAAASPAAALPYDNAGWMWAYLLMAATMLVGVLTVLRAPEPASSRRRQAGLDMPRWRAALRQARRQGASPVALLALALAALLLAALMGAALKARWLAALAAPLPWPWLPQAALALLLAACLGWLWHEGRRPAQLASSANWRWRPAPGSRAERALAWALASFVAPFADFFRRYGRQALLVLALIGTYRISDTVMGVMANPFYVDLCFTKAEVAAVSKTWGLGMTLLGAFLGGALALRFGVMRILMLGALLSAASNVLFAWLAGVGHSVAALMLVVSADNLASGLASAAFVAYLSSLTNLSYSATQYALFSSLMLLAPKFVAGYSGQFVNAYGYASFFTATALLGLPVLALVALAARAQRRQAAAAQSAPHD
ncbi:MAG: AmpG family muropeptide MFS transporter [Ottowia sp.]